MSMRQKIIMAAYQAFYQKGFHACSVEYLAKQANTTKRTLYAHFASKDILIQAVLAYRHQQFMSNLVQALTNQTSITTAYLDFICDWVQQDNFYGCLFINACAEYSEQTTSIHQAAKTHKNAVRNVLHQKLTDIPNGAQIADALFVFGEGLIVAAQSNQKDVLALAKQFNTMTSCLTTKNSLS